MGSSTLFRSYYYGQYRWDNYLLDVQGSIDQGTEASRRHSREHLELQQAILDHAEATVDELREQNRNLVQIRETLESGLEELRAEFNWGFTLMIDRMDNQIELLSEIAQQLDAIHKTLQSPLMTQARELFDLGQERFRKGLWDKALEAFIKAEEKNEVDFLLQLQTGKLLLYGKNEDNNVVNLDEAERHLLLAARFAQAEKETIPQWSKFCGEAHFHAAVAEYLIGEQKQKQGKQGERDEYLRKALEHLLRAIAIWPEFTEIINLQAKCHSLLGQRDEAISKLRILSDRDRRYFAKAKEDGDFQSLLPEIEIVFQEAITNPGLLARAAKKMCDENIEALAWAKRSDPNSSHNLKNLDELDGRLQHASKTLGTVDVDIEALHAELADIRNSLDDMTNKSFTERKNSSESEINSTVGRVSGCESQIVASVQNMKSTRIGAGWGCLIAFVVYFGVCAVGASLMPVLGPLLPQVFGRSAGLGSAVVVVAVSLICGLAWAAAMRYSKNKPLRDAIAEMTKGIRECQGRLPMLRSQRAQLQEEIRQFSDWRLSKPVPPLPRSRRSPANSEGSNCSVVLTFVGANKIDVIKAVRQTTGLDLSSAKELVDRVPHVIKEDISQSEANAIKKTFDSAGATVQIRQG